jgi:Family of unknown function (DUF6155)
MATSLKKHLNELEQEELIEQILNLAKRFKDVKVYFDMELGDAKQQAAIVDGYKKKIEKQFFPTRGTGKPKPAELRKLINHFKTIAVFPFDIADLTLYRVEQAVEFNRQEDIYSETFFNSAIAAYEEALKLIQEHQLETHFADRCQAIKKATGRHSWGWGDEVLDLTDKYLSSL